MGLFIILVISFFNFAGSIKVDCGIRSDPDFQGLFEDLKYYFAPNSQVCGFKVDRSENSSEINLDFPVDNKTEHLTFIYTTTSIPILPAELFKRFPDKSLGCGFYKLPSIEIERDWFKYAGNLSNLFFNQNRIPKLDSGKFVDLKKLKSLNLQRNSIEEIDKNTFAGLDSLTSLNLSYNDINYLHPDLFKNLTVLTYISLKSNKLVQLHPNLFKNLTKLTTLFLSANLIKDLGHNETGLFDDLVSLQYLYLNFNSLATPGAGTFKNLGNLLVLYVGFNLVRKIDETTFSGLKKLEFLDIPENKKLLSIHPKTFQGFVSLKKLVIHTTWIKNFDENLFSDLINLETLDLCNNLIDHLPENIFENLTSLRKLNLDYNPIKSLSRTWFKNLINLEEVSFYAALFETVPDDIFKNNGNMTAIVLRASIKRMSNKIFSHLTKLKNINLADNDCISVKISNHNSNSFLTEDILIPCSCQVSENGKNSYHLKVLFILIGLVVAIIFTIFVMMLVKCCQQKLDFYLNIRDGKNYNFDLLCDTYTGISQLRIYEFMSQMWRIDPFALCIRTFNHI
jgi:Leucine-rich repeat (LRR) protein